MQWLSQAPELSFHSSSPYLTGVPLLGAGSPAPITGFTCVCCSYPSNLWPHCGPVSIRLCVWSPRGLSPKSLSDPPFSHASLSGRWQKLNQTSQARAGVNLWVHSCWAHTCSAWAGGRMLPLASELVPDPTHLFPRCSGVGRAWASAWITLLPSKGLSSPPITTPCWSKSSPTAKTTPQPPPR